MNKFALIKTVSDKIPSQKGMLWVVRSNTLATRTGSIVLSYHNSYEAGDRARDKIIRREYK